MKTEMGKEKKSETKNEGLKFEEDHQGWRE